MPFDTLRFEIKSYGDDNEEVKCYTTETVFGTSLAPYRFVQSEESANREWFNIRLENTTDEWDWTHLSPQPIYDVAFRLFGDWGDWLYIMLDDTAKKCAYIRSDSLRMQFTEWESYMKGVIFSFDGNNMYDKPDGSIIQQDRDSHTGRILSFDGDWVKITNGGSGKQGWVRWKDKNGILPGIWSFDPIK